MWSGLGRFRVFILLLKMIYLLAVLGLVAAGGGSSPVAVGRLPVVVAPLVADHGLWARGLSRSGSRAPEPRLSTWGARAQCLCGS